MRKFPCRSVIARCQSRLLLPVFGGLIASLLFVPSSRADQVIPDDLIVDGSLCVGFDCVNNENFGFDTLILKENNLRIYFNDTSNSGSFPTNDWRIQINDSSNGGSNYFGIEDATTGKMVFRLVAGAPADALVVNSNGNLGLGTATPATELHIVDGNTPTLRLQQDNSIGWGDQTWDIAGNEANFFVRDVTNGSNLPFRIKPGAPTNSLFIAADGNVGLGTASPQAQLHTTGSVRFDALSSCPDGIATNEFGDLTCLPASTATLVQQAGAGQPITVGATTDGMVVDITGVDGARVLTGVASATAANDAINLEQLLASGQSVASILGGGSQVNPDGTLSAPGYTIQGKTLISVEAAFTALDSTVTSNSIAIADEASLRSDADAILDGRLTDVEGDVTALDGRLTDVEGDVTALDGRLTDTEGDVTALDGRLTDTEGDVTALDGRLTTAESDINTLQNAGQGMSWTSDSEPIAASATGAGSTAIGSGATARTRDTAVGYMATITADGSVAIGANSTVNALNSVAVGADSLVEAGSDGSSALGQNARVVTGVTGSVALGQNAVATESNTVSVGAVASERRITNVSAGVNANDAVTVQQLHQLSSATGADIGRLDHRIDNLDDRMDDVGALSMAIAQLSPNHRAQGDTSLSLGIGYYSGANAVAAGLFHHVNDNVMLKASITSTFNETGGGGGVTFSW